MVASDWGRWDGGCGMGGLAASSLVSLNLYVEVRTSTGGNCRFEQFAVALHQPGGAKQGHA